MYLAKLAGGTPLARASFLDMLPSPVSIILSSISLFWFIGITIFQIWCNRYIIHCPWFGRNFSKWKTDPLAWCFSLKGKRVAVPKWGEKRSSYFTRLPANLLHPPIKIKCQIKWQISHHSKKCTKKVAVERIIFNPVPSCALQKLYHVPYHVPSCSLSVPSIGTKAIKRI